MTARSASLGMYDSPALQAANDALWTAIAVRLSAEGVADVPAQLDRTRPLAAIWDDPALLLAQICGYPLVTQWRGRLRYVATPRYRVPGCEGAHHRSRFVVRRTDPAMTLAALRGRRAAINEPTSNTGMNLLRAAVAAHARARPFFGAVIETGSHTASARLVASGGADIAAIDAVSFAHLERHESNITRDLRTLGWSVSVPGLPLVTARTAQPRDVAMLRRVLQDIADDPALADIRETLLIDGFDVLHPSRYRSALQLERGAGRAGYPLLA
jgi:ABC-type phosphate/phosphonate transport system substrate-binding protein